MDRLVGLEIDRNDQNGSCFGFSEKSLVATSFDVVVLHLRYSMVVGVEDEDASMVALVGAICVGW